MMRTPFFSSPGLRHDLVVEARSWIGTPFRENGAAKGRQGGVDCVQYLHAVFVSVAACEPQHLPVEPVEVVRHWHEHHATSRILAWLMQPALRHRVCKIEDDEPAMIGDLVALRVKKTEHHLGLDLGHEVAHVAIPAGVITHSMENPQFTKLIAARYRIMEATR